MDSVDVKTQWYDDFCKNDLPESVAGKVFVVSGTTSGTGYVAARTAAQKGGEVLLLNRASERSTKSLAKLKEEVPSGKFVPVECDLQSFDSVKKAAEEIKAKYADSGIYCVCWNAGIMASKDFATKDGFDNQMQTNHLSHFLLTAELMPLLEKYAAEHGDARIVNHSSGGRHMTPNKGLEQKYFEQNGDGNLGGDEASGFSGGPFLRYFQTKLANAVFTQALHNKLKAKDSNIRACCADPGMSATPLGNHLGGGGMDFAAMADRMQTPEDGAMGIMVGMMSDKAESGVHYGPEKTKGPAVSNPLRDYETDKAAAKMLWDVSEKATGVTFSL